MRGGPASAGELPLRYALVIVVLVHVITTAVRPVVSYRALALGASVEELGLISAAYALLSVGLAIPIGTAIDRVGAKWFIVGALAVSCLTSLVLAVTGSVVVLVVTQAFVGLALVTTAIGFQTLVANAGPIGTSEARFGTFTAVVSLGQLAGPVLVGVTATGAELAGLTGADDPYGTGPLFLMIAAVGAVALLLALRLRERRPDAPTPGTPSSGPAASVGTAVGDVVGVLRTRSMPSALFASLVVLCTIDLLPIYLPLLGEELGLSVAVVSGLLAVRAAASFTVRVFMGRAVALVGRKAMLVTGSLLGAASIAAVPLVRAAVPLFVLMAVLGLVLGVGQPLTMAWVARTAPVRLRSTALAVRLTANRVGQLLIPAGAGLVAGLAGTGAMFYSMGAMLGLTAASVVRSSMDDSSAPPGDPGPG